MSPRQYLAAPDGWPTPPGYSHAVITSGARLVVISGQVPLLADGTVVGPADFEAQTRQVFTNLETVLRAAGATWADVVKLTYFVVNVDPEKVKTIRAVRDGFLPAERRPASSLLGVSGLFRPDVMIEVEALAELP